MKTTIYGRKASLKLAMQLRTNEVKRSEQEPETFAVYRVYKHSERRDILFTGISKSEAQLQVSLFESNPDSMVVYDKE